MWGNDTKCKYMFIFPLKNLARKELIAWLQIEWPWGCLKNAYKLLKSNNAYIVTSEEYTCFSLYGQDILSGISKGTFEIPHKIFYPYIERQNF